MLLCGLAWKRNCLSQSLFLLSQWLCHSLIHYAQRCLSLQVNTAFRISGAAEGLWSEIRLSRWRIFLPSITQSCMSSACVHFWTDHTVGKAWNEWKDEWNRSTLADQVNPEGCPKTLGQVEGMWQAPHCEMVRTQPQQWTYVICRDLFNNICYRQLSNKCLLYLKQRNEK